ncbi:MAG: 23S rRNA (uracil(1939)-C(5))-methyltransferase RlmD [Defluviitaleaceae bacterium]|nr:23S rRNA (uracil(1939)-C(5))-methyltransferase RlmD [Defluviitaleaceae bacterium]MCL2275993.1 23S rRNA (uracil(1939)-C(5))-methyltransferase RlmD [Defluviitaleaceae bacterium]
MTKQERPPRKNEVFFLDIENVNAKGFGVGRVNGFVLLVDGALTGDRMEARVLKTKTRYGYAKIQRLIRPSPYRIKSPCAVSNTHSGGSLCGGCQFQHCNYAGQLAFKKKIVIDALERIAGIAHPPVADVQGMDFTEGDAPFRYRNKAVFPVVPSPNADGFSIGMYAARSHRIVEVNDCLIQHPSHVRVLSVVKEYMRAYNIPPYDEIAHRGLMRQVMVRTSRATGEIMVVLVINGEKLPGENALAEALSAEASASTVLISPHTERSNNVLGERFRTLTGSSYIEEHIGDVRYRISAPSFFQVNPIQVKVLYDCALEMAKIQPGETVLDAHAGAGGVALYAARNTQASHIAGIDIVAPAIINAKENAALNGIENTKFITGAAEEVIPTMLCANAFRPGVVFLDPPRRGCESPLLDALITAEIPRIVYISCDPATLARDIKHLCASGYRLEQVQPVDMFPHTGHVEAIASLRRADT